MKNSSRSGKSGAAVKMLAVRLKYLSLVARTHKKLKVEDQLYSFFSDWYIPVLYADKEIKK